LEALLQGLSDSVAFVDPAGKILLTNRQDELVAEPPPVGLTDLGGRFEIFHPDGRSYDVADWPALRSARTGEVVVGEEFFRIGPDGSRRSFSANSAPIHGTKGEIVAAVIVAREITEEKRARERLAYLLPMLDQTEDAIIAVDRGWRITAWNDGAERMYGWDANEVLGRHVPSFVRMALTDQQRAQIRREAAERGRWRGEATVERKDGSSVSVELINVAVRGEQGEITGFLGIHRDVTERKRSERALRKANQRAEAILESITARFSAFDREWRYTYINEPALAQARSARGRDFTAEDIVGLNCWEFLPELVGTKIDRELHRAMREQRPVEFEAYSEASSSWLEVRAYPSEDGLSVYSLDITARKRAEEEMSRRAEQQALVADLGLRALARGDLQELMDDAAAAAALTLGVELAAIARLVPGRGELSWRALFGFGKEAIAGALDSPVGPGSLAGYTLSGHELVISDDVAADERLEISPLFAAQGATSAIAVVIPGRTEPFGILEAAAKTGRSFGEEDVSFLRGVANVVATAVERSLAEARVDEALEGERLRIGRDLHDEASSELAEALAQAILARASAAAGADAESWSALIARLQHVAQQLRGSIYDLRLSGDGRGFADLLSELVSVQAAMAAGCEIGLYGVSAVPAGSLGDLGIEMLRIVREAIRNACLHSGATAIRIDAGDSTPDILRVEVSDNGSWPDREVATSQPRGTGILGMRERAALIGADLQFKAGPEGGTRVIIAVGLPA
jgi:PAS domain S-box-containing protein